MGIDRDRGSLQRRKPVMIVERVEMRQMQNRRQRLRLFKAHAAPRHLIFVSLRPAVAARHDPHAVGPQRVELAHRAVERHRFDIRIAGELQMRDQRLDERRAVLPRIGLRQQIEQRMAIALGIAVVKQPLRGGGFSAIELHRAMHDRILDIALARRAPHNRAASSARGRCPAWKSDARCARLFARAHETGFSG